MRRNGHERDVKNPATIFGLAILWIGVQRRLVVEPIAVLIEEVLVVAKAQAYGVNAQFRQRVKLFGLGDAIVVLIDPQQQVREHAIPVVDDAVAVAAVLRFIEFG